MEDITVTELRERINKEENIKLLDVREPHEREDFNIGGSFMPLGDLTEKLADLPVDQDEEIVIYCRSGNRSGMAKKLMQEKGYSKARNLLGGMLAWKKLTERE
jgi:rhodanese-related sulfurtransferase